jgi:hypothetical protein
MQPGDSFFFSRNYLSHHANLSAQIGYLHVPQISPVQAQAPLPRVVEPHEHRNQGGLPTPRAPYEGTHRLGWNHQAQPGVHFDQTRGERKSRMRENGTKKKRYDDAHKEDKEASRREQKLTLKKREHTR